MIDFVKMFFSQYWSTLVFVFYLVPCIGLLFVYVPALVQMARIDQAKLNKIRDGSLPVVYYHPTLMWYDVLRALYAFLPVFNLVAYVKSHAIFHMFELVAATRRALNIPVIGRKEYRDKWIEK